MRIAPDVRAAFRSLRRSPGFVAVAALTLGLGVGAAGATFTLLHRVALEPLPVSDESSVVVAWGRHRKRSLDHFPYTYAGWRLLADDAGTVSAVAATEASGVREGLVEDADAWTAVRWSRVLGDFFGVVGVTPVLGRTLAAGDDVEGGPRVAVVSHGLWLRRWGGAPSVLGSRLKLNGRAHTVVGVLPPDFDYPVGTEVWTPMRAGPGSAAEWLSRVELDLVARLTPVATPRAFAAELEKRLAGAAGLAEVYREVQPVVRPLRVAMLGDLRPVAVLLFAGALLLLVVAGVNVSHLMLLRAGDRTRSSAVRRSMGASRTRLLAEPIVEAAVVTGLAGVVAALVAAAALRALPGLAPAGSPRLDALATGTPTWSLIAAFLAVAAVVLTAVPAVGRGASANLAASLRAGGNGGGPRRRARGVALGGQAALALWSVAAAALLLRSVLGLTGLDPGFEPRGLQLVRLDHRHDLFAVPPDWPDRAAAALDRLAASPGIVSATLAVAPPLVGRGGFDVVPDLEADDPDDRSRPYFNLEFTLPGFYDTLRLPAVQGRAPSAADAAGAAPVVVVNETAARLLWPGESPVGQRLRLPFPGFERHDWTVVGVVADARYRELLEVRPSLYVPLRQLPIVAPRWVVVRSAGPLDPRAAVTAAFTAVDPSVRVLGASSVERHLAAPLARPRLALAVLACIAGLVLVLAAVGAYGVVAADVRSRYRELGIRTACGARPRDLAGLVLRRGLLPVAVGAVIGTVATLASGRFVAALLYGVGPADPVALTAAAAIVLAATTGACVEPALRAARVDPAALLRDDARHR